MIDLSTQLANAAIAWDLAATNADAEAASVRALAADRRRQSEAQAASLTVVQRNSPDYQRSHARRLEQEADSFEVKARQADAKAAAHRERAEYARRGLLYISRSDTRDSSFMNEIGELFRECRSAGRTVWQGEGTGSGVTAPNGQPIG